jgi:hypothetical protein
MNDYIILHAHDTSSNYSRVVLIPGEYDLLPALVTRCVLKMNIAGAIDFLDMFLTDKRISLSPSFLNDGVYNILVTIFGVTDIHGDLSEFMAVNSGIKDLTKIDMPLTCNIIEVINQRW